MAIPNDKKILSAPISKGVFDEFKVKCKEVNMPMNVVLELFCREFVKGKFEVSFKKNIGIDIIDKEEDKRHE